MLFIHVTVCTYMYEFLKVRGHDSNFLDSRSYLIEIGPTDPHMTLHVFGAIKFLMATDTDQDIQNKLALWFVLL